MTYEMNLHPEPFKLIKEGKKTIEMRLNDERRRNMKKGDIIVFENIREYELLTVKIINLYKFKNFEELYAYFDKKKLGYSEDEYADPSDMEKYYSKDKIEKYGVLAIEIERC